LKKIDQLPIGPEWKCSIISITGDRVNEDGEMMHEQLELWYRDPIECVKGLIGNPAFKDFILYVAEHVYVDCQVAEIPERGKVRNAERSYTEVPRSRISGTTESTGSVGSGLGFNLCVAPPS
jgi:hypothetical protein